MEVVLKVRHNNEAKMVGKVFRVGRRLICLHEESGSQGHIKSDSPGGIDTVVVDWLLEAKVDEFHHFNRSTKMLYVASISDIATLGIKETSDGRTRAYLGYPWWCDRKGPLPYDIPWIDRELALDPRRKTNAEVS